MSVIQSIRDKYARVAVIAIALSLLGFIAMDAFTGRSNMFGGGQSSTVGSVNGKKIDIDDFRKSVTEEEQQLQQSQQAQYLSGPALGQQAIEGAWNREVYKTLVEQEADKIGLRVTQKELNDILFVNPPADLRQQFTNQETGQYDAQGLLGQIKEIRKSGTQEKKDGINSFLARLTLGRLEEKYSSLLNKSVNYPKWMVEKQNAENSQLAKISFVKKPYTDIADSTIKVSDEEINEYVSKHKNDFKQVESRSISYVTFSALPSPADTMTIREQVELLKPKMDSTKDIERFLQAEGVTNFYNSYISGKNIRIEKKDSIFKIPVGSTYGPYLDGGSYTVAKLIGVRQIPDSVKVRHILISTMQQNPQTGRMQQIRDTTEAKALIDSVRGLINAGQSFDSLVLKFSDDGGSKEKGGVYETGSGQMVPPFNDYMFTNPVGSKGVVKTEFGYHYMEILSQKGSATGYKIAYLSKPIVASSETDKKAKNDASGFAVDSRDEKSFNEVFEKKWKPLGYNKGVAYDITPSSYNLAGLGVSRDFVKKIYDAKKGAVLEPEQINDNYVVAVVTAVYKEGTKDAAAARMSVEPLLRNKKKAELIKKQIGGNITSLEAVATAWGGKQVETADSVRISGDQRAIGFEPKVIGAAFNAANRGKLVAEAIEGTQGVYVVRVDNVVATPALGSNVAEQRKAMAEQAARSSQPMEAIRQAATIKDKRPTFY